MPGTGESESDMDKEIQKLIWDHKKVHFKIDFFTMVFMCSFINKLFIILFIEYFTKAQVKQNTWNQVSVVSLDLLFESDSVGPCNLESQMFI